MTQVELRFTAQNGHTWTDEIDESEIDTAIEEAKDAHDDLEVVFIMRDDGPEEIWRFE